MTPTSGSPTAEPAAKKLYNRPHLQVYGDLREITNAVAHTTTNRDGGLTGTKTRTR